LAVDCWLIFKFNLT